MMSIYITQQQKDEWESEISRLEYIFEQEGEQFDTKDSGKYHLLKQILSKAIVLPVEEDYILSSCTDNLFETLVNNYPNGVIIKEKP